MDSFEMPRGGDRPQGTARPEKLAHVVLRTESVEAMRDWYVAVLGGTVTHESQGSPKLCFITYDDEHHRIALVEHAGMALARNGTLAALDHIAFTFGSLPELMATYDRLRSLGIEPFWPINHGPTISLYYKDPDGNRMELMYDTMSMEEAWDYTNSRKFAENPIGVIFDPAELSARLAAGEPVETLVARPDLPEGKQPIDMIR